MEENSIVRENLMHRDGYSPYCGNMDDCIAGAPRTQWDENKSQFVCRCGWVSEFPDDFIIRYKKKWNK